MTKYVLRRLLQAIPTLFGIATLTFLLSRLSPGDPIRLLTFGAADITSADVEALRRQFGFDRPMYEQYLIFLGNALKLEFGNSILYHRDAATMILERIPNTLQLTVTALFLQLVIGIPLGITAALNRGKLPDQVVRVFGTVGHAVPDFWFGLVLIIVFAVQLRLLPSQGMLTIGHDQWDLWDRFKHLLMPAFALSLSGIAVFSRLMRTETLNVIAQDYIRTANAKGLREHTVTYVHALRNALLPIIAALGGILAALVGGALVIEQIFTWPGLGQFTFQAAVAKDYPVIMAGVMISSVLLVLSFVIRDIVFAIVDPRIKLR
ncbi:MAG TPA: ABC transporter permease [Candidatus Limnocylindrales bacterium]|nr:ABC transporter permease [Candidatus Limnocylindrales bacterium]